MTNRSPARTIHPRGRPRRLPPAERREQLLDAAAELLLEGGMSGLTMEGLAERAGVSKGLGYNYFGDVNDVASALWDREVTEVYRRIEEATSASAGHDFSTRMGRALEVYLEFVSERGTLLGSLERSLSRMRARPGGRRRVLAFVSFWADQIEGEFSLSRPRAEVLAAMMLSAVDASVRTWQAKRINRADATRMALAFLFDGLRGVKALPRDAGRKP